MSKTPHQALHQQLLQLRSQAKAWLEGRASGRFYPSGGICDGLEFGEGDYDFLHDLMQTWPAGHGGLEGPLGAQAAMEKAAAARISVLPSARSALSMRNVETMGHG